MLDTCVIVDDDTLAAAVHERELVTATDHLLEVLLIVEVKDKHRVGFQCRAQHELDEVPCV